MSGSAVPTASTPRREGAVADRLGVTVLAMSESCADAVQTVLDAGGPAPATLERNPEACSDGAVLVVADSIDALDSDILVAGVDRDFLLLDDVEEQLVVRVELLRERTMRRRARKQRAERLRRRTMDLALAIHRADTIADLAVTVTDGLRSVFGVHRADVVIPADPHAPEDAASSLSWGSPGGESPALLDFVGSLESEAVMIAAQPTLSSAMAGTTIIDLSRENDATFLGGLFDAEVQRIILVPVGFEAGAQGAMLIEDAAAPERRTAFERSLLAFLGVQVGRAVCELWLRDRQLRSQHELEHTSAELQRLIDERDDLAVVVRSIADAINVGVIFFDTDNKPMLHNRMVERILALTEFDIATGRSNHVYASDRHTRVKQDKNILTETLEGDQRGLIYWVGDPEREQRAVVTEAHEISRPNGDRLGSAIVTYDVTDLANAIEIREEYLATVSHELRTPLTSIVGYLDLIDDGHDLDALGFGREFRTIQRSAEQMLELIRDLLSTTTSELSLRIEPMDLTALLSQSVSSFRPTIEASHQTLLLETPGTVLAHLDAARIKQVVDNLISNASKYTPEGGAVTVSLEPDGDNIVITVADTGRGISKTDQVRLFDRFFRSRDARDSAIQGVGLGLTIVKTIVDAHGGSISADSELGHGSTFTVRLPMRAVSTPLPTLPMKP
jgi:signal transduction histidine kinase